MPTNSTQEVVPTIEAIVDSIDARLAIARAEAETLERAVAALRNGHISAPPASAEQTAPARPKRTQRAVGRTRPEQVLLVLKGRGPLTGAEVATAIGIKVQHAHGELSRLKAAGKARQVGNHKWHVT